ncbi:MAG: Crp/Fnr family transcriptional regulator [Ignavibacterium sp.]|nr:Crp/Fnr family transcriptional regulator [Ignavibacterium sp.]
MNEMIETLSSISPLDQVEQEALAKICSRKKYKKNTVLLQLGEVSRKLYFIIKGLGRVYYIRDGNDITDYFAMDMNFLGGLPSYFTGEPSHKAIELLEDSEVFEIYNYEFEKLCNQYHQIEKCGRKLAIMAFIECQSEIESIRFFSAKERYFEFEKKYPGIMNRAPLKHIASYLGTTQVSVSRIRAGIQ